MFNNTLYLQQLQAVQLGLGSGSTSRPGGSGLAGVAGGTATGAILGNSGTLMQPIGPVVSGPGATQEFKIFQLPILDMQQRMKLESAKKYAMDMSIKTALMKQNSQLSLHQSSNVKRAQALVLLSRIYVGSVNYDITEDILRQTFIHFGPIKNVSLSYDPLTNKHKGFCFVEYELPEAAQLAMEQMNGFILGGRPIKVGRPSNMPNASQMQQELIKEADLQKRIYVTNVHDNLADNDLKEVFEAFGKVTTCRLERDPANPLKHRGFGFVEYETAQSASDAVQSMNMFDLGGRLLRVGVAMTPLSHLSSMGISDGLSPVMGTPSTASVGLPQAAAIAAANINALVLGQEVRAASSTTTAAAIPAPVSSQSAVVSTSSPSTVSGGLGAVNGNQGSAWDMEIEEEDENAIASLEQQERFAIKGREARGLMMQRLQRRTDNKVLVLRNMVGPEEIDDSLEAEVTEECSSFGEVERVIIYQERCEDNEDSDEAGTVVVKIFVVFSDSQGVAKAAQALNGRFFAGRTVIAQAYDQHLFDANDLSH